MVEQSAMRLFLFRTYWYKRRRDPRDIVAAHHHFS